MSLTAYFSFCSWCVCVCVSAQCCWCRRVISVQECERTMQANGFSGIHFFMVEEGVGVCVCFVLKNAYFIPVWLRKGRVCVTPTVTFILIGEDDTAVLLQHELQVIKSESHDTPVMCCTGNASRMSVFTLELRPFHHHSSLLCTLHAFTCVSWHRWRVTEKDKR